MNVLVIPEDARNDQYVLRPIVEAMLEHLGLRHAKVRVCLDPVLGGVDEALKWENLATIMDRYRYRTDLFLLIVDRDGNEGRAERLADLEGLAQAKLPQGRILLAENAWQEIEVWVLAGMDDLPSDWTWKDVRAEPNPKERYWEPYAKRRGLSSAVAGGRRSLALEAAKRYGSIRNRCPEDVGRLEERVAKTSR